MSFPRSCFVRKPRDLGGLTFLRHADLEALLQPAVLTAVACDLVDLTVFVSVAGVHHVLLDAAAEKSLDNKESETNERNDQKCETE